MSNMALDDVLEELARWGYVSLDFKWGSWHCEVRSPGYLGENLMSYHKHTASTAREVVDVVYAALETWRESGAMAADRARYIKQRDQHQARYDAAPPWNRDTGHNAVRAPEKLEPERPLQKREES